MEGLSSTGLPRLVSKDSHHHMGKKTKKNRMNIMQNSVTFFSTSELKYTNFKTGPNKSKIM